MDYEEAYKLLKENENAVLLQRYNGVPSFRIKHLLIAPKESPVEEKTKLLKLAFTEIGIHRALIDLGMINQNLDVYIVGEENDHYFFKTLHEHTS